jgi:hypothetical protein
MENSIFFILLWLASGLATIVAASLVSRSRYARYVGRAAVGALFIIGGALLHVINLATGADYSGFADPALFGWVTEAWESVVVSNHVLFIGLLAVFEATVGVLSLSGGRRTQLGYAGVIAFYLALWLFGWMETVWVLLLLPPMLLLLRAERRPTSAFAPTSPAIEGKPPAHV